MLVNSGWDLKDHMKHSVITEAILPPFPFVMLEILESIFYLSVKNMAHKIGLSEINVLQSTLSPNRLITKKPFECNTPMCWETKPYG